MIWLWNIGIPPSIYHLSSSVDTEFGDSRLGIPTTNNSHSTSIPGLYYAVTGSSAVSANTGVLLVIQQTFAKAKKKHLCNSLAGLKVQNYIQKTLMYMRV